MLNDKFCMLLGLMFIVVNSHIMTKISLTSGHTVWDELAVLSVAKDWTNNLGMCYKATNRIQEEIITWNVTYRFPLRSRPHQRCISFLIRQTPNSFVSSASRNVWARSCTRIRRTRSSQCPSLAVSAAQTSRPRGSGIKEPAVCLEMILVLILI